MHVRLRHELALSAYPEDMRCLELPLDAAARTLVRKPRLQDLQSAPAGRSSTGQTSTSPPDPDKSRFLMARSAWEQEARLEIGANDGRAFSANWAGPEGAKLACRLTPRGVVMDASPAAGPLDPWRWALLHEAIVAPLDAAAGLGDEWESPVMTPLANAQLRPIPLTRQSTGRFRLEGRGNCRGHSCFVVSKTVVLPAQELRPQDLVGPEYAANFDEADIDLLSGRHTCVVRTWIDETTRLPVRTTLQACTVVWFKERQRDDRFISDHDWIVHEFRSDDRRVLTLGRLLVAEFD